jgi:hypothetical protein
LKCLYRGWFPPLMWNLCPEIPLVFLRKSSTKVTFYSVDNVRRFTSQIFEGLVQNLRPVRLLLVELCRVPSVCPSACHSESVSMNFLHIKWSSYEFSWIVTDWFWILRYLWLTFDWILPFWHSYTVCKTFSLCLGFFVCFTPRSRILYSWKRRYCRWRTAKVYPQCSGPLSKEESFIVPHLL